MPPVPQVPPPDLQLVDPFFREHGHLGYGLNPPEVSERLRGHRRQPMGLADAEEALPHVPGGLQDGGEATGVQHRQPEA